jgi:hypothetical protein
MARARAIIGGPILESRTPWSAASSHRMATLGFMSRDQPCVGRKTNKDAAIRVMAKPENRNGSLCEPFLAVIISGPGASFQDVENGKVDVDAGSMCCSEPICNIAFRCNHALLNAGRCSRTMTADAENAFASVVILYLKNRSAVGPRVVGIDQIGWARELKIYELPTNKSGDRVCAAFSGHAVRRRPLSASCDSVRYPAARGRDKRSRRVCERDLVRRHVRGSDRRPARVGSGWGRGEIKVNDIPANVIACRRSIDARPPDDRGKHQSYRPDATSQ